MGHLVALNFEDGITRFVECDARDTVADAAYRLGLNIPLDCRDGACGTCKLFCESGQYDGGSYIEDALTDAEAAQGYALACQMKPRSDLVLRIAASSAVCKTKPAPFEAVIGNIEKLSETTTTFSLRHGGGLAFLPGQYINIDVPGSSQQRSYSFSSAPGAESCEFLVRNIPGGLMTGFLAHATPSDRVSFSGPFGGFYLREIKRPLLMLAGGTGLAPFLSMLGQLVITGCEQRVHLIYGVTNDADLVQTERLDAVASKVPLFSYSTCVAAAASTHPRHGYVTQHIEPAHLNGGDVDVYLCGPPAMVEAVRGYFTAEGVIPASFHFEKFNPSAATAVAA